MIHMHCKRIRCGATAVSRVGFTLVELLVVVSIFLILLTFTLAAVDFSMDAEKVRSGARQVQSYLAGARDRAIHAKEIRGVRFIPDANNGTIATSMVFISPPQTFPNPNVGFGTGSEKIFLERETTAFPTIGTTPITFPLLNPVSGTVRSQYITLAHVAHESGPAPIPWWWLLKKRGLLYNGLRIRIPKGEKGSWYQVETSLIDVSLPPVSGNGDFLRLITPLRDTGTANDVDVVRGFNNSTDYEIELPATILPQDPMLLPDGVAIDLAGSLIPGGWRTARGNQFMDVMFSPNGTVVGAAASSGIIHLYVGEIDDFDMMRNGINPFAPTASRLRPIVTGVSPLVPADEIFIDNDPATLPPFDGTPDDVHVIGDRNIVSVFTQTGSISVYPVNPVDAYLNATLAGTSPTPGADGLADDPYVFAETGGGAN